MKTVLEKLLIELSAPEPRIDYVRGMLEVLILTSDTSPAQKLPPYAPVFTASAEPTIPVPRGLDEIKRMAGEI